MTDHMYFESRPSDRVLQSTDEPEVLLLYDGVPDTVRVPHEIAADLGGGKEVAVRRGYGSFCPCGGDHKSLILELDIASGLHVAECVDKGYLWFVKRKK